MRCVHHQELEAVALCRICLIPLCKNCALAAAQGLVCSDVCGKRAETIDRMIDLNRATLAARGQLRWFVLPALFVVIGSLLVWGEPIFGTSARSVQVWIGILLLVSGLAAVIHVLYIRKQVGT